MKALIISDNQEVINLLSSKLVDYGYDIIVYRWLLKALDNIEEIRPDYIILSAEEYPRHWKTLASFVKSGIGGCEIKFNLYNADVLSEDDKKKAKELGVDFYVEENIENQVTENNDIPTVDDIVSDKEEIVSEENKIPVAGNLSEIINETINNEPVSAPVEEEISESYELMLTHPVTQNFISGDAVFVDKDVFDCKFDRSGFMLRQDIKFVSLINDEKTITFSANVLSFNKDIVRIKVEEYYEI